MSDLLISKVLEKYDTDKVKEHTYGPVYDAVFSRFDRFAELNILEIGIQKGGSLKAWRDYFPNARVTGIDIIDEVKPEYRDESINYIFNDVNNYLTDEEFDIVIDDGSHSIDDVLFTVQNFKLKSKGVFIIEDVQKPVYWITQIKEVMKDGWWLEEYDRRGTYDNFILVLCNY